MKNTKILMCATLMLLNAKVLAAGHVTDALIKTLYCGYFGAYEMCSITFDKPIEEKDSCHTNKDRMQFKVDSDIGKALLSVALTANASGKKVEVYSRGTCTIHPKIADLDWIKIKE